MGTVERTGDATSEMESGEEEATLGGGELAQHLMKSSCPFTAVNECRKYLFTKSDRQITCFQRKPLFASTLFAQYVKESCLSMPFQKLPSPFWGWRMEDNEWTTMNGLLFGQFYQMSSGVTRNEMLAAITSRIHAEALAALPANVRRRVRALRSLQKEFVDIEAKFYSEVHALECKYTELYKPLYEKRALIVNGKYEPTDAECQNPWRDDAEEEELARAVQGANITDGTTDKKPEENPPTEPPMDPNVKGIPDFWHTIFKNVSMLSEMVQEHDEPILKSLEDIKVQMHENPIGYTLEFHFAPNEYFTNTVLTKEYSMKCVPDDENPLEFEGPEIYSCKGCEINWNKGKNVTVKTIKKKQKHKSRGSVRTVTKSVQADSFFNFFSPPVMPDDPNSTQSSEIQTLLTADFEIGHYFRERVVSRAVLLYTGEGLDEEDDDYEEEEEEECSSEESDEEPPPRRRNKKVIKPSPENPAECKPQ